MVLRIDIPSSGQILSKKFLVPVSATIEDVDELFGVCECRILIGRRLIHIHPCVTRDIDTSSECIYTHTDAEEVDTHTTNNGASWSYRPRLIQGLRCPGNDAIDTYIQMRTHALLTQ